MRAYKGTSYSQFLLYSPFDHFLHEQFVKDFHIFQQNYLTTHLNASYCRNSRAFIECECNAASHVPKLF